MPVLEGWVREHTVEDVLLSRSNGSVIYKVDGKDTVRTCLNRFIELRIHNLLIQQQSCPSHAVTWLRLKDTLKLCYQSGRSLSECLDQCIEKTDMGLSGPIVSIDNPIAGLLARWSICSTWIPPVLLTNGDANIVGVLTAVDLFHYVYLYGSCLYKLLANSTSLIAFDNNVSLLDSRSSAATCLKLLLSDDSPDIVGLVNEKGALIGSATLLAFLPVSARTDLNRPVLEYLAKMQHKPGLVTCNDRVTFEQVLQKILHNDAHHVWKVNEFHCPVGVIDHTHLIQFIKGQAGIN